MKQTRNQYHYHYKKCRKAEEKIKKSKLLNACDKSLDEIKLVTPEVVKKAAHKLKSGKSDPVYSYSSDCFKNSSDEMFEKLSMVIQSFLVHGHITQILLLATLVPLIKDKLGSTNISKNYFSIAISSILLKLIDWVFIILFGSSILSRSLYYYVYMGSA